MAVDDVPQELAGVAVGDAATSSGVPSATTMPPPEPPSGPMSIDPVGGLDDVEVVLDHDDGVALVDEPGSTPSSLRMSSKCRPVVGSSRT